MNHGLGCFIKRWIWSLCYCQPITDSSPVPYLLGNGTGYYFDLLAANLDFIKISLGSFKLCGSTDTHQNKYQLVWRNPVFYQLIKQLDCQL